MSLGTQKQETKPLFTSIGGTRRVGGDITADPLIAQREAAGLSGFGQAADTLGQAAGTFGGQISGLRREALGTLPEYIEAQVSPLQRDISRQRGALSQQLARRGIAGSSFGAQAQTGQALEQQRALQDARAQALAGGVGQLAGLSQMELQAQQLAAQGRMQEAQALMQAAQAQAQREIGTVTATGAFGSGFKAGI